MPTEQQIRARRALRLATGTALCLAASFGLALPIPFIAPMLALTILAAMNRPLPFKASLGLALVLMITTGSGRPAKARLAISARCGPLAPSLLFCHGAPAGITRSSSACSRLEKSVPSATCPMCTGS